MAMDREAREALELSIEKWKANENITNMSEAKTGPSDCPLCALYHYNEPNCVGCPVYERMGEPWCRDTPYTEAERLCYYGTVADFKVAARKEREFLESLREEDDAVVH